MTVFEPTDEAQAREMVAWAAAESQSLEIVGGGSKRALGRAARTDHTLNLSRIAGIIDYEPGELILTAKAATPLADIQAQLAAKRQMLSFEPPDWSALLGAAAQPTLGGVVACNLSGSRRVRAGSARDYFLGFAAINGWGEAWKAGAKVVKNVTGYDMCKVQAGAYGTLSVLTELTLKVMPSPETACTLLVGGLSDADAIVLASHALNTPYEISAVAHLPAAIARRSGIAALAGGQGAVTALRLEGPAPSVAFRADAVEARFGRGERLEAEDTARFWAEVGSVHPLLGQGERYVWRLCPTPSAAPAVVQVIRAAFDSAECYYDWGGGLVWLDLDPLEAGPDGGAAKVRAALAATGGHATLIKAPETVRATVPVFDPIAGALSDLSERVKNSFDPRRIFNPGRMQEGQ